MRRLWRTLSDAASNLDSMPGLSLDLAPAVGLQPERRHGPDGPATAEARPTADRLLGRAFDALFADPDAAQAGYESLSAFAGSDAASDLLARGGADGAAVLAPLREGLTGAQHDRLASRLGDALGTFGPSEAGAVGRIVPGATVLRDADGVPVVAALGPDATAAGAAVGIRDWVVGIGIEARGQYGFVSGSVVAGIVFDDDGSFGTFAAVGAGPGIGLGASIGPTAFGVVGPEDISNLEGFGVQVGGGAGVGAAVDVGVTIPLASDGAVAGAGLTGPAGPTVGMGISVYSELGYTRVGRLFELSELQARRGAVLEQLSGPPGRVVDGLMAGLRIQSYDAMASYLLAAHQNVTRQLDRILGSVR